MFARKILAHVLSSLDFKVDAIWSKFIFMSKPKNRLIHKTAPKGWYPDVGDHVEGRCWGDVLIVRGWVLEHRLIRIGPPFTFFIDHPFGYFYCI